jgi:hypothetical protein
MLQGIKPYLRQSNKDKLQHLPFLVNNIIYNNKLNKLIDDMKMAMSESINVKKTNNVDDIKNVIQKFASETKLSSDLNHMSKSSSYQLDTPYGVITLYFLYNNKTQCYINHIIHAVNTFCHLFKYDYNGLTIYVCLDNNIRTTKIPYGFKNIKDKIHYLQSQSSGFSVSGTMYPKSKTIIITKTEEIVKLLFHEMIHYIGLDNALVKIHLSEAYAEFLAVLLIVSYETLQLSKVLNVNVYHLFYYILTIEINYSLYLTTNVLKFYGYNQDNYKTFFKNKKHDKLLWEYIVLRTILLLNLDRVMLIVPDDYKVTKKNINNLLNLLDVNDLIKQLKPFIELSYIDDCISFLAIDLDWSKIDLKISITN